MKATHTCEDCKKIYSHDYCGEIPFAFLCPACSGGCLHDRIVTAAQLHQKLTEGFTHITFDNGQCKVIGVLSGTEVLRALYAELKRLFES